MSRSLKFLRQVNRGGTSDHPIAAIERALLAQGVPAVDNDSQALRLIGKVAARTGLARHIARLTPTTYIVPIMGPCFYRFMPVLYGAETIPLAHDCWEPNFDRWTAFLQRSGVRRAFFTARQSADAMAERVPGLDAQWLPEAIELGFFNPVIPLAERAIDVLELGRRSDRYHQAIASHCLARGYHHRYQRSANELVFDSREAFQLGMTDTKLLVCFPSSMTNPERSGTIETMTLRYLEGIACKSVLIGHAPAELIDLFGYDPMVAADFSDPAGQLDRLLAKISDYDALVQRNYRRLLEVGTWDIRIADLLDRLSRDGIAPAT